MGNTIKVISAAAMVLALTAYVFSPVIDHGFSNWDEDAFLTENPDVRGLSWEKVGKIFTSSNVGLYVPLVILSYSIEYHFFGMNPKAFHATNLVLHLLNCLLVFWFIYLLSGEILVPFIVSLLFGIHTLNVESVAWIVERKDVLFAFFYLGSLIAYLHYRKKGSGRSFYFLSLLLFVLSLLAKVMAVSLVFVFFSLDLVIFRRKIRAILKEQAPFLLLSLFFYIVSVAVVVRTNIASGTTALALADKVMLILYLVPFYIQKIFLPVHLSTKYSLSIGNLLPSPSWLIVIIPLAATAIFLFYFKKKDQVLFGTLFSLVTLLPVFPLVFMGYPYGDRYAYIPGIGIFYIFAWAVHYFFCSRARVSRLIRIGLAALLVAMIAGLSFTTGRRLQVWENNVLLWTDVIKNNPGESVAYNNRGDAYIVANELEKAMADFDRALSLNPGNANAYNNRGTIFFQKKEYEKALSNYSMAIRVDPLYAKGYFNRGTLWGRLRSFDNALNDYDAAIRLDPHFTMAYYYRAITLEMLGRPEDATRDFARTVDLDPDFAPAIKRINKLMKTGGSNAYEPAPGP